MGTRRNQSTVSVGYDLSWLGLAAMFVAALGVGACARRQYAVTKAESPASAATRESETDVLQFDNQATVYVDVYLVGAPVQWRLGRVSPGMHAMLRVPSAALDWTAGAVQLAVIPGSQMSAEALRDPRAVISSAQLVSQVLGQRWTFRQSAGVALQLQATWLPGRW